MAAHGINQQSLIYQARIGVVAKWQGKGLQNPHHGFKSHRRLKEDEPVKARFF
jgi:hypothetical protein